MVYQHPSGRNNALLPFAHNESRPPNELALSTFVAPAPPPYARSGGSSSLAQAFPGYSSLTSDSLDSPSLPSSSIVDSEDGKGIYFFEDKRAAPSPALVGLPGSNCVSKMDCLAPPPAFWPRPSSQASDDMLDDEDEKNTPSSGAKRRRNFGTPSSKRFHDMACDLPPSSPPAPPADLDDDFDDFTLDQPPETLLALDPHCSHTPPSTTSAARKPLFSRPALSPATAAPFSGAYPANSSSMVSPTKHTPAYRSALLAPPATLPPLASPASPPPPWTLSAPHPGPEPWGYAQAREIIKTACNDNNRSIHLDDLGLTDVPPELADLKHMVWTDKNLQTICSDLHLYLVNNCLTRVPAPLLALDNLTVLSLRGNRLSDLPPAVAHFPRLQNLSIGINRLRYLPCDLLLLPNLTVLAPHPNPYVQVPAAHRELAESIKLSLAAGTTNTPPPTENKTYHFLQSEDTSDTRPAEYTEGAIRYWVELHVDLKKYGNLLAFARPVAAPSSTSHPLHTPETTQPAHLLSPLPSPTTSSPEASAGALQTPTTDTFASSPTNPYLPSPVSSTDTCQPLTTPGEAEEDAARLRALRAALPSHALVGPPRLSDTCARVVAANVRPESAELDALCDARTQPVARRLVDAAAAAMQRGARCGVCRRGLAAESAGGQEARRGVGYALEWWDGIKGHHGLVFVREFCSTRCVVEWAQGVNSQLPECFSLWEAASTCSRPSIE